MKVSRLAGIAAGFLLSWCALAPASSSAAVPQAAVETTLANGMHVVLLPSKLAPIAMTVLTYGVGSNDDTLAGIAHATEHMMFRGTKDISATQFAIITARAGAQYNAQTTQLYTQYWFKLAAAYAPLALRLEADRMTGAAMTAAAWKTERPAIEQEVRAHESLPGASIQAKVLKAMFGDTPYAHDAVGTIAGFDRMQASNIAAFYHRWYRPGNATLVVSGNIDPQKILAEIHRDFDSIPKGQVPEHPAITLKPITAQTIRDTISELPVPIAALTYRYPTLRSPDFAASQVLQIAFDSARGELAQLQQKGEILGGFAFAGADRDAGNLGVAALGLPGQAPDSLQTVLTGVIDDYRKNGVPEPLIDAAKLRLLSAHDYRQESISGLAFEWATSLVSSGEDPDAIYQNTGSVSASDVNRMLQTYLDPQHALTVLLTPKGINATARADTSAAAENVKFTPEREEPLPAWTSAYFRAGLQVPPSDRETVTCHLRNGLTLTVRPEHIAPTISLKGAIRTAPDLYEAKGKEGVASLTSSMLDWGTQTYDRAAYAAQLDAIAANADLGTSFAASAQSKNFDRVVALLADGMLHPAFPAREFATVKNNTVKTLAAVEHLPRTQAAIAQLKALYPPGDPRRRRPSVQSVLSISLADIKRWFNFAYRPDETTIAIVGDVTPAQARATIERYFGQWHANGRKPSFRYPIVKSQHKSQVRVTSPSSTHSEVTLTETIDVHRGSFDAIALSLADTMLSGEGIGSILFRDLRTRRGYVYEADSDLTIGRSNSTFSISFAADPKNVARAQAAALADVRALQERPVSEVELQRAKALLLARRILPLDSYDGIASDILSSAEIGYTSLDDDVYWRLLIMTTPQQVQCAMRRYIKPSAFSRVIVAPGS